MMRIVQQDDPVLRKKAHAVPLADIQTPRIQNILARMSEALAGEKHGVALAAPQIGESVRIFIVSHTLFAQNKNTSHPDLVFINPKIQELSKKTAWLDEGCLSCEAQYGEVKRSIEADVNAYNKEGEKFSMKGRGLLAQIFQHEIDHLDGVLFIDHARGIRELAPDEQKNHKKSSDKDRQ